MRVFLLLGFWLTSAGEGEGDGTEQVDPLLPILLVAVVEAHGLGKSVRGTLGIGPGQGDRGGGSDNGFFGRKFFFQFLTGCFSRATRAAWRMPRSLAPKALRFDSIAWELAGLTPF